MSSPPTLTSGAMTLRAFRPDDVDVRAAAGHDPRLARLYGVDLDGDRPVPMSLHTARAWYEERVANGSASDWAIAVDGRLLGETRLHSIDTTAGRARFAIGLHRLDATGQGIGRTATRLVLRHAFDTLDLHRIDLRVLAFNTRAIACYRACGFVVEGRERETVRVEGAWHDDLIMAILEHEYRAAVSGWDP